jgi:hypothetical protein
MSPGTRCGDWIPSSIKTQLLEIKLVLSFLKERSGLLFEKLQFFGFRKISSQSNCIIGGVGTIRR